MPDITQEELKALLDYDPETGIFTNKQARGWRIRPGQRAGCLSRGYLLIRVKYKLYQAHRLAWLWMYGEMPEGQIDHINHVRSDNRLANLRLVSHQENHHNLSLRATNTSGITGVSWSKAANKWTAQITVDGEYIHLGYFASKAGAAAARRAAEETYGFHPNHGKAA